VVVRNHLTLSALVLFLSSHAALAARPELPKGALPVPLVPQATRYSCGAAALLSVLQYFKSAYVNESGLYPALQTTPEAGTHPRAILRVALSKGLEGELKTGMTLDDLRESLARGMPVILDIQAWPVLKPGHPPVDWKNTWEEGHYVVLVGMDEEFAYAMDPSTHASYGYLPLAELIDRWHDYEASSGKVERYIHLGIRLKGATSLPKFPSGLTRID
jgi:predicted double-glycine peptidase